MRRVQTDISPEGRLACFEQATATSMLTHPQHIKCLEAVMLALHLTNGAVFAGLDRVPVGFKTTETATGHEYR